MGEVLQSEGVGMSVRIASEGFNHQWERAECGASGGRGPKGKLPSSW